MDWKVKYERLLDYVKRLETENRELRSQLGLATSSVKLEFASEVPTNAARTTKLNQYSSSNDKIRLFRSLFRGREDVFARRWHSLESGKSGYAPAHIGGFYTKSKDFRAQQDQRIFKPLGDQDIYNHLRGADIYGRDVVGIYPISNDDTCYFLAIDFDDGAWKENATTVRQVCAEWDIPCTVERSRSGEGAHVWIFFLEPISCATARQLGSLLLTAATERDGKLALSSYDRMFPCQDTLPKGGFGNLIALPLQGQARKNGNSLFVDESFSPYPDQWAHLAQAEKLSAQDVGKLLRAHSRASVVGELYSAEQAQRPWEKPKICSLTAEDFYGVQHIIKANMLFIAQDTLSPRAKNQIIRLAAFQNPDFYKSQAMRLPVYNKPRIISTAEERNSYLALPRGCEPRLIELLQNAGVAFEIEDKTFPGKPLLVRFRGELRPEQAPAAEALLQYKNGVLAATTAFGKTVIAAYLIAQRKVNTLILVHTQALLNQWKQSLGDFLVFDGEVPLQTKKRKRKQPDSFIGQLGGGKNSLNGLVDVAIVRSLSQGGRVKELVKDYGMVIVDECHHASAVNYERVLKEVNARYIYGLTATPTRRDGHHPIMFLQCGPIRYRVDAKSQAKKRNFTHIVIPRFTTFSQPLNEKHAWTITDAYQAMQQDEKRNARIVSDIVEAVSSGKTPLVLTERYEHAQLLFKTLSGKADRVVLLSGRGKKKEKQEALNSLARISSNESLILVATGRYIGEGFDLPRLDTLILAMPISWQGTLAQYAGRLHRNYEGKQEVLIYDYVDIRIPMLERMYQKRLTSYSAIGYGIRGEVANAREDVVNSNRIFTQEDYSDVFMGDVRRTKKDVLIVTPYPQLEKVKQLLSQLPQGSRVRLVTADKSCFKPETEEKIQIVVKLLEENNIQVTRIPKQCQCCAIFDKQLLWYGGINFLGYKKTQSGSMRLFSSELAEELVDMFTEP